MVFWRGEILGEGNSWDNICKKDHCFHRSLFIHIILQNIVYRLVVMFIVFVKNWIYWCLFAKFQKELGSPNFLNCGLFNKYIYCKFFLELCFMYQREKNLIKNHSDSRKMSSHGAWYFIQFPETKSKHFEISYVNGIAFQFKNVSKVKNNRWVIHKESFKGQGEFCLGRYTILLFFNIDWLVAIATNH